MPLTEADYLACFLVAEDLPELHQVQDSRLGELDPDDTSFTGHGGLFTGLAAWMGADDAAIWRLVDIRIAFPDDQSAIAYHRERLRYNAEGNPAVRGAPPVGAGCAVFGGTQSIPIAPDVMMTMFFYLFRVRNVVAKLFVAQSAALPGGTLAFTDVTPIARRVEARIGLALSPPLAQPQPEGD